MACVTLGCHLLGQQHLCSIQLFTQNVCFYLAYCPKQPPRFRHDTCWKMITALGRKNPKDLYQTYPNIMIHRSFCVSWRKSNLVSQRFKHISSILISCHLFVHQVEIVHCSNLAPFPAPACMLQDCWAWSSAQPDLQPAFAVLLRGHCWFKDGTCTIQSGLEGGGSKTSSPLLQCSQLFNNGWKSKSQDDIKHYVCIVIEYWINGLWVADT